jgi:hypothetical protein
MFTYVMTQPDPYEVTLTVYDDCGCETVFTRTAFEIQIEISVVIVPLLVHGVVIELGHLIQILLVNIEKPFPVGHFDQFYHLIKQAREVPGPLSHCFSSM